MEIEKSTTDKLGKAIADAFALTLKSGIITPQVSRVKNKKVKNVGVYTNQPLVIINHGNAKGKDILHFANEVKDTVHRNFQIELEEEVLIL